MFEASEKAGMEEMDIRWKGLTLHEALALLKEDKPFIKPQSVYIESPSPTVVSDKDLAEEDEVDYSRYREKLPMEMFELFFIDEVINNLVEQLGVYAGFLNCPDPKITSEKMRAFVAILILSGYNPVPSRIFYWDQNENTRYILVYNSMRRDRNSPCLKPVFFPEISLEVTAGLSDLVDIRNGELLAVREQERELPPLFVPTTGAIEDGMSQRKAAQQFNVPRATLLFRTSEKFRNKITHGPEPILTSFEERAQGKKTKKLPFVLTSTVKKNAEKKRLEDKKEAELLKQQRKIERLKINQTKKDTILSKRRNNRKQTTTQKIENKKVIVKDICIEN
ncbi:hypothetical protein ILUMI_24647 [Ignelater luminosus]|uniref:PiggyBac transposable element-derived protein domain-containing protein n=1 Tax=Ignelater luminosus TaxID=2038154 RepID=A0A8K0C6S1_IGNLU|nr:hypothetical protein ILUMI_24647 [Ignelater luminosus]